MTPKTIKEQLTGNDRAVSPVIGVILMVAITVILAAVIGTFVLDLGQSAGNSAPSASINVDANAGASELTLNHKGGDGIDAQNTRVQITDEANSTTITFEPVGSADVMSVGNSVTIAHGPGATGSIVSGDAWTSYSTSDTASGLSSGNQYSVTIIDTESQRVIYETTITA